MRIIGVLLVAFHLAAMTKYLLDRRAGREPGDDEEAGAPEH